MKFILASGSKSRRAVFDMLGINYEVIVSNADEKSNERDFGKYVMELSRIKAEAVKSNLGDKKGILVSADSIVCIDDKKFEKPKDKKEAFNNIKLLSGRVNHALTGVTVWDLYKDNRITFYDVTDVYFKEVSDYEIQWYVDNDEHILERAGYSIANGKASIFIDKIVGDYYNIIGMPVGKFYDNLKKLGYNIGDFAN